MRSASWGCSIVLRGEEEEEGEEESPTVGWDCGEGMKWRIIVVEAGGAAGDGSGCVVSISGLEGEVEVSPSAGKVTGAWCSFDIGGSEAEAPS